MSIFTSLVESLKMEKRGKLRQNSNAVLLLEEEMKERQREKVKRKSKLDWLTEWLGFWILHIVSLREEATNIVTYLSKLV